MQTENDTAQNWSFPSSNSLVNVKVFTEALYKLSTPGK